MDVADETVKTIVKKKVISYFSDCARKVCQLGESCEGGNCARVAGRFCTLAIRDCGEQFTCQENKCVDQMTALKG